jgi:hypothetical protein
VSRLRNGPLKIRRKTKNVILDLVKFKVERKKSIKSSQRGWQLCIIPQDDFIELIRKIQPSAYYCTQEEKDYFFLLAYNLVYSLTFYNCNNNVHKLRILCALFLVLAHWCLGCGNRPTVVFSWWARLKCLTGFYINVNFFDCYTLLLSFIVMFFSSTLNFTEVWSRISFFVFWSFQFSFSSSLPLFHPQWWVDWSDFQRPIF